MVSTLTFQVQVQVQVQGSERGQPVSRPSMAKGKRETPGDQPGVLADVLNGG